MRFLFVFPPPRPKQLGEKTGKLVDTDNPSRETSAAAAAVALSCSRDRRRLILTSVEMLKLARQKGVLRVHERVLFSDMR